MSLVLIAGASGLFGSHASAAFAAAGWQVRHYQRGTDMTATGADVIVNAMNPPNYHNWAQLIPQITAQVLDAARKSGATILVAGNVYNYGTALGPWGPDTPQNPQTRKGKIRVQMEADYRASGLPVIILRGGDYLDAKGHAQGMKHCLAALAKGKITPFGAPDVPRAYAYLPDMAKAAVLLAERRADLPRFADIPFAGVTFSMTDMRAAFERMSGRKIRLGKFPWAVMRLTAPFWEMARELLEMRYLHNLPHRLDDAPLTKILPDFTPLNFAQVMEIQARAYGLISTQTGR
jgi:nucleoside-diphosphate-sugar epimerase